MSDLTNYSETEMRDWMSQGTDPDPAPSTLYVALHTGNPGETGANNEVTAGDYSRASVTAGSGWSTPNENDFENANQISFGTATNDWGTISHVSLWDSSSSGNCLAAFSLASSKTISTDDEAIFPSGDLSFSLD